MKNFFREHAIKAGKTRPWVFSNVSGTMTPWIHADYKRGGMPGRYQLEVFLAIPSTHGDPVVTRSFYTSDLGLFEEWLAKANFMEKPGYRNGMEIDAQKILWTAPRNQITGGVNWEKKLEAPTRQLITVSDI